MGRQPDRSTLRNSDDVDAENASTAGTSPVVKFVVLTAGFATLKGGKFVIPPLLPTISAELGLTSFQAGISLTGMTLAFALLQYPSGRLSDLLSRRTILVAGVVVLVTGFVVLIGTTTYYLFLLGTILVGTGEGLYGIAGRAWIDDLFTSQRGKAYGFYSAASDAGGAVAAVGAVGVLAVAVWRASFLPVVLVLAVVGVLLHRLGDEPYVVKRVALGTRGTVVRLVADRRIRLGALIYGLFMFSWQGVLGFLPTLLQVERGMSSSLASVVFSGLFLVGFVCKPLAGELSDRMRRSWVAVISLGAGALGLLGILVTYSLPFIVAGVVVFAAGLKGFIPVMQAYLMDIFPAETKGGDLGALRSMYLGVGSLGPAYVGFAVQYTTYTNAFLMFVGCLGLAALGMLFLDRTR